jgi:hypothetical protein
MRKSILCGHSIERKRAKRTHRTIPRHQNSAKRGKTAHAATRGAGHKRRIGYALNQTKNWLCLIECMWFLVFFWFAVTSDQIWRCRIDLVSFFLFWLLRSDRAGICDRSLLELVDCGRSRARPAALRPGDCLGCGARADRGFFLRLPIGSAVREEQPHNPTKKMMFKDTPNQI